MKRSNTIAIALVAVVTIVSIAILMHQRRQERKREDIEKIAKALKEYRGGGLYPPGYESETNGLIRENTEQIAAPLPSEGAPSDGR
jgi:hypothetical protein